MHRFRVDITLSDNTIISNFYSLVDIKNFIIEYRKNSAANRPTLPISTWLYDMAFCSTKPFLSNREVEKIVLQERIK